MNNKMQELAQIMQMSQGQGLGDIAQLAQLDQRQREFDQTLPLQKVGAIGGLLNMFMQDQHRNDQGARGDRALDLQGRGLDLQEGGQKDRMAQFIQEMAVRKEQLGLNERQVGFQETESESRTKERDLNAQFLQGIMNEQAGPVEGAGAGAGLDPRVIQVIQQMMLGLQQQTQPQH